MKISRQKILSAAAVAFMVSWNTHAQMYSQGFYRFGITYYGDHCIGSGDGRVGYEEYSFSTDAKGHVIDYFSSRRRPQPGDTFHQRTEIYFGPGSFSVPMRPLPFMLVVAAAILTTFGLGDMAWK